MNRKHLTYVITGLVIAVSSMSVASATPSGVLNVGGNGTATASLTGLAFSIDPAAVPAGSGNASVGAGTNLLFIGGPLFINEGILINSGNPVDPTALLNPNFLRFASHANLVFDVEQFGPGSSNTNCVALAINASCSVFAGSPLVLTRTNTGTNASLSVSGRASDTGVGGLATGSFYVGQFSNPIIGNLPNGDAPTPENIQKYFCPSGTCTPTDFASGRSVSSPFGGQFQVTVVPEPASMGLVGLSLFGAAFALRRFNRQRNQA